MELDVKAVMPTASGWRTNEDGDSYVTNWRTNILVHGDIWDQVRDEPQTYFKAPLTPRSSALYMSQEVESGYSTFFLVDPNDRSCYGGREFELDMFDGSTFTLEGPWSSNSRVVNNAIMEDAFEDDPHFDYVQEVTFFGKDWRQVGLASALGLRNLKLIMHEFLGDQWHLAWADGYIELHAPEPSRCEAERII